MNINDINDKLSRPRQWDFVNSENDHLIHLIPLKDVRKHKETGRDCWCGPRYENMCPLCDEYRCCSDEHRDGCGFVECDREDAVLVIHRAADGRP